MQAAGVLVTALFVSPTGHVDMPSGVDATPGGTEPGAPLAAQEAASPEAGHGCVPSGRLSSRPLEVVEQTRAFWAVLLQAAWPAPVAVEGAGEAANAPAVSWVEATANAISSCAWRRHERPNKWSRVECTDTPVWRASG